MDTSTPRLERLRAFLRPVIEWSYLVTGMVIFVLIAAWALEQFGFLESPVEGSIPDAAYLALAFASMAVGGLIFLGWPFALAVIWLYRRDRRILVPAAFFLAAELAFAVNTLVVPGSEAMFILFGGLLGLHAVTGVSAWARRRQGTRLHGWAILLLALPFALSCTPPPEVRLAEWYESPQVHRPSNLIILQGVVPRQNWEIFTVRPDGTALRNLTNHPGEDAWPILSPDGRWILFLSNREGSEDLYRMASDGSDVRKLAERVMALVDPHGWVPGGREVVYADSEGIKIVAADGSGEARLFVPGGWRPLWSPDGERMLYKGGPDHSELRVITRDGRIDRKLHEGYPVTWMPDSRAILFYVPTDSFLSDLYLMRLDTEEIRKIMSDVHVYGRSEDPRGSWSPDGTRFALAAANVRGLRGGAGIVILDREGNVVDQHMKTGWFEYDGTLGWLDGRTIVLSKFHNPLGGGLADDPGGIYVLDVDSGEERQILRNVQIVIDPDDPPW